MESAACNAADMVAAAAVRGALWGGGGGSGGGGVPRARTPGAVEEEEARCRPLLSPLDSVCPQQECHKSPLLLHFLLCLICLCTFSTLPSASLLLPPSLLPCPSSSPSLSPVLADGCHPEQQCDRRQPAEAALPLGEQPQQCCAPPTAAQGCAGPDAAPVCGAGGGDEASGGDSGGSKLQHGAHLHWPQEPHSSRCVVSIDREGGHTHKRGPDGKAVLGALGWWRG